MTRSTAKLALPRSAAMMLAFLCSCYCLAAMRAEATPLEFRLVNVSGGAESRLKLSGTAHFADGNLVATPQVTSGAGSASTLYDDRPAFASGLQTNVSPSTLSFPGGSTASAHDSVNALNALNLLSPAVGGTAGKAAAAYGLSFSSNTVRALPPIVAGDSTIPLGNLTAFAAAIALRDFGLDVTGSAPLTPSGSYPQSFDASQLAFSPSGTADIHISARLEFSDFLTRLSAQQNLSTLASSQAEYAGLVLSTPSFLSTSLDLQLSRSVVLSATAENGDSSLGSLEHLADQLRLTLPVQFEFAPSLPTGLQFVPQMGLKLEGQLVGETAYVVLPEPSTAALLALGLLIGCCGFARRGWLR